MRARSWNHDSIGRVQNAYAVILLSAKCKLSEDFLSEIFSVTMSDKRTVFLLDLKILSVSPSISSLYVAACSNSDSFYSLVKLTFLSLLTFQPSAFRFPRRRFVVLLCFISPGIFFLAELVGAFRFDFILSEWVHSNRILSSIIDTCKINAQDPFSLQLARHLRTDVFSAPFASDLEILFVPVKIFIEYIRNHILETMRNMSPVDFFDSALLHTNSRYDCSYRYFYYFPSRNRYLNQILDGLLPSLML